MERPDALSSETIALVLPQLKHLPMQWPYRFHKGCPVDGTIEIEDGVWQEEVTMGNHLVYKFKSAGPFDEAFVRGRVAAISELWKTELNVFCGEFGLHACCRFRMEFPGSEDDLGIHECAVCFELTSIVTNCLTYGRSASHSICAGCLAKLEGICPHKHSEFRGGFFGCRCCSDSDSDSE